MENIIKKAIEGGYKEGENWKFQRANIYWAIWLNGNGDETTVDAKWYLMSSDFWQALGKACGWKQWGSRENPAIITYDVRFADYLMKPPRELDGKLVTDLENAIEYNQHKNITAMKLKGVLDIALKSPMYHYYFCFHQINIEEGFEKAVTYLEKIINE